MNILDDEETLQQEEEQAENPNAFILRGNAKHKPPKKAKTNYVQEESKKATKGRKKTAPKEKTSTKKKQKEVSIDDARFAENLAVATEVIAQSGKNSGTSEEAETSQQLSTGMSQYVLRNPPAVINPVGKGVWKCKGCKGTITSEEQSYLTTWYSTELESGENPCCYRTNRYKTNTICNKSMDFSVTEYIFYLRAQAFASPADMASSTVKENVFLAITPTLDGVCGMLLYIILNFEFDQN